MYVHPQILWVRRVLMSRPLSSDLKISRRRLAASSRPPRTLVSQHCTSRRCSRGCLHVKQTNFKIQKNFVDPGCLSRIPDPNFFHPGSRIWIFSIPDPGSEFFHPGSRIRIKELKYFNKKMVSKLSEIRFGLFIPDPDPDLHVEKRRFLTLWIFTSHHCCGSGIYRIQDPDFFRSRISDSGTRIRGQQKRERKKLVVSLFLQL